MVKHMVSNIVTIYGQIYSFQDQPYGSRSTTWFKVKKSPKSPYPTNMLKPIH